MSADLAAIVARELDERRRREALVETFGPEVPHYQPTAGDGHDDYECAAKDRRALLVLLKETRDAGQEVLAADGAIARQEIGADRRWDVALAALDAVLESLSALPFPTDKTGAP